MVIQRIQTLYLLLAVAMMACFTFLPIAQINTEEYSAVFTTMGVKTIGETSGAGAAAPAWLFHTWALFIVSLASFIVPFIAIFKFKAMKFQRLLCIATALLVLGTGIAAFVIAFHQGLAFTSFSGWTITPFIAFFAAIMAWTAIGKDMRLLSSSTHIR